MRIGTFAQRNGISQDTVRYYLERGLLVARKKGMQYFFTKEDEQDLRNILDWKKLEFSLTSILELLTLRRLSGEHSDSYQNYYRSFLEKKQQEVAAARETLDVLARTVEERLDQLKQTEEAEKPVLGIPLTSLELLSCPQCGLSLRLGEGYFQDHMVMEADIACPCGYRAKIRHGVFIEEASLRPKLLNEGPMPTKEEYIKSTTPGYINYLYQTMAALVSYLKEERPHYILEISNCSGFILMQYIDHLPAETVFLVVDHDLDRLMRLKRNLEAYHDHKRFLFLAADYHRLPLAKGSIDAMVDFGMVRKLYLEDRSDLPRLMAELLVDGGAYVASTQYVGKDSKRRPEALDPENTLDPSWFRHRLEAHGLQVTLETSIGPVQQEGAREEDLKNLELFQLVVKAVKGSAPALKTN